MRVLSFLSLLAVFFSTPAHAEAPLLTGLGGPRSFGTECLHRNDDGSSVAIDLTEAFPEGLDFFGTRHTRVFVNTNGNITFNDDLSTFTPDPFPVADQPMIAPYWADVDIREPDSSGGTFSSCATGGSSGDACHNPTENGVWWNLSPGRMVVTWHRVGYYRCHTDLRMNFQLILTASPTCSAGDFDVEFRFNQCQWTTGDASGGTDGFGGTPGQSGFDAGNSVDFVEIAGSRTEEIHNILCRDSNVDDSGVWQFQIRSGAVICPDAGDLCDTGMIGVCAEGRTQCVGGGTECQPVVPAAPERCDNLDNDCDGMVDEEDGDPLCDATKVCDGTCIARCFEGGCAPGFSCGEDGLCVEDGCEDVECPPGQRCSGGECVGACDGVVCPPGQSCRGGRCLDLCEGLECDPGCSICSEGDCVPECSATSCPEGETCGDDGRCLPTACVGVSCEPGFYCTASGCVDECEGTVCPDGLECLEGECTTPPPPPPPPPPVDAGTDAGGTDTGGDLVDTGMMSEDSGSMTDTGRVIPTRDDGCGCRVPSATSSSSPSWLAAFAIVGLMIRRRRR